MRSSSSTIAPGRTGRLLFTHAAFIVCVAVGGLACSEQAVDQQTRLGSPIQSDGARFMVTVHAQDDAIHRGSNSFTVDVRNADGPPGVLGYVTARMPAHGHVADAPLVVERSPGHFEVANLVIAMAGQWEIDLRLSRTGATDDDHALLLVDVP